MIQVVEHCYINMKWHALAKQIRQLIEERWCQIVSKKVCRDLPEGMRSLRSKCTAHLPYFTDVNRLICCGNTEGPKLSLSKCSRRRRSQKCSSVGTRIAKMDAWPTLGDEDIRVEGIHMLSYRRSHVHQCFTYIPFPSISQEQQPSLPPLSQPLMFIFTSLFTSVFTLSR